MIQYLVFIAAALFIAFGLFTLIKGEVTISEKVEISGASAQMMGVALICIGILLVLFGLFALVPILFWLQS